MRRTVFLYSELAGYLLSSIAHFANQEHPVTVVHWPVNPEAPFHIPEIPEVDFIDREGMDAKQITELVNALDPDLVLCSGWMDIDYVQVMKNLDTERVLLLDNQWEGNWKQWARVLSAPWTIRRSFDHAWVPGEPQRRFAQRLGFGNDEIHTGFYTADVDRFAARYRDFDLTPFPRKLFYVGRYIKRKGIFDLWESFIRLNTDFPEWQLHCIGVGEEWDNRLQHPAIFHHGFQQPEDLADILNHGGVFVLPSHFEPWGVVVQEMALMGMPMVVSDRVGAASQFCDETNARLFPAGSKRALEFALRKMMSHSDDRLWAMGKASHLHGLSLDKATWSKTLRLLLYLR